MKLKILYEDKHIIVVVKPAGILSQEDYTKNLDMMTIIKDHIKQNENKEGNVFLGLVHRLDRMTSGVMVFAKRSKAASRLSAQIKEHQFSKTYLALVEGELSESAHLEHYLTKNENTVTSEVTTKEFGKLAILDYQVLKRINNNTLIEVKLKTGRHHQIRVQMSAINHPIVGDILYGSRVKAPLHLQAYKLSFYHPMTGEHLTFTDELPKWSK